MATAKSKKKLKKQIEGEVEKIEEEHKREEEDQQRKLAEERQLEEKRRLAAAAAAAEAKLEEASRLQSETSGYVSRVTRRSQLLRDLRQTREDAAAWERFLACDALPVGDDEADLTAYLSLEQDQVPDATISAAAALQSTQQKCGELEKVAQRCVRHRDSQLVRLAEDSQILQEMPNYARLLRDFQLERISAAVARFARYLEEDQDGEKYGRGEITRIFAPADSPIRLALWINTRAKNFRPKLLELPDLGIRLELPKAIALQWLGRQIGVLVSVITFNPYCGKSVSWSSGGLVEQHDSGTPAAAAAAAAAGVPLSCCSTSPPEDHDTLFPQYGLNVITDTRTPI
eukprot:GHVT01024955.1.p1 GENE.GHVT01024955.1~~GHVT01024955.1.p1  ORF type:complete len:344 (+),score=73.03 GHVT01024955.1:4094-5125(+)